MGGRRDRLQLVLAISVDIFPRDDRQDKQGHHQSKFVPPCHLFIELVEKRGDLNDGGDGQQHKREIRFDCVV